MFKALMIRKRQGMRTSAFPKQKIELPEPYRGIPGINPGCPDEIIRKTAENCPLKAINPREKTLDLGKCVFCGICEETSDGKFVKFTREHQMWSADRRGLICNFAGIEKHSDKIRKSIRNMFKGAFSIRQVSAGGCNACEADLNVLQTPFFDLSRFGIQFTASPRHADAVMVTGPVTCNMELALRKTLDATPDPKIVIASGTCAVSGGIFSGNPEVLGGVDSVVKPDLYIPGCPPHPLTALGALLSFLGISPEK